LRGIARSDGATGSSSPGSEPAGAVDDGIGEYELRTESVRDDCQLRLPLEHADADAGVPAFLDRDWGHAIVRVDRGADGQSVGANVPLGAARLEPGFEAPRSDILFNTPLSFDRQSSVPGCPARSHLALSTLAADSAGIDIEWQVTFTGVSSCSADAVSIASDCTADRIFHFEWLRACGSGSDLTHCR